jgi:hypothetical protein
MKKVIAALTTVILSLAAAQECAAQRELPGPIPAAEKPPDLFMPLRFEIRTPSEPWVLRLGSASTSRRLGVGKISHFAWGTVDSGSLLVRLSESELCQWRHHLLINPGIALVSDLFVSSSPLGGVCVGLQGGALPLHSRVAVYWYPIEGVTLTIGLDFLRGWDWGLDLLF